MTMANAKKFGYFKPVKKNVNPLRWVPGKKVAPGGKKKTG